MMRALRYYKLRARRVLRKEGIGGLLRKAVRRIRTILGASNCAVWFKKDLREIRSVTTGAENVSVEMANHDIEQWLSEHHAAYPWMYIAEEIRCATENGHLFAAIRAAGSIIGYIKIGLKRVYILDFDHEIPLPPDTAFIYDTFLLPSYRGKKIIRFALDETSKQLTLRGIRYIWCHIPLWNHASRKAFEQCGFKAAGFIRFVRVFKLKFLLNGSGTPCFRMDNLFYEIC
jgi:GNAT superfamily N-acetyltransferase